MREIIVNGMTHASVLLIMEKNAKANQIAKT